MELLLNLAWLLLALPAYWLWCGRRATPAARKFTSLQCLLCLSCVLVVLFPVVSATDDLHAMRAEMEESPSGERNFRQASHEKGSVWKWQSLPALVASIDFLVSHDEDWQQLPSPVLTVSTPPSIGRPGRAPPDSFPA